MWRKRAEPTEPCWKGRLALASRKALHDLLGTEDARAELLERLTPEAREHHTERLIATDWYSERHAAEIVEVAATVLDRPVHEVAQEVGRRGMTHQFGGIGMAIARILVTPRLAVRYSSANWKKYRNTGDLVAEIVEPGVVQNTIVDWGGHCPALCRGTWGAFEEVWKNMKGIELQSVRRLDCISSGARNCRFELRFDGG